MLNAEGANALALRAAIACALMLAWTVHAQDAGKTLRVAPADQLPASHPSTPGVGWALLVGVGAYPDVDGYTVSRLSAPAKDVDALRTFLTDPDLGAFPASNVRTLIDEQATKAEILLALANMRRRAAPEDLVLFYFSGHGYRPHDEDAGGSPAYLLPYVTNPLALNNPDIGCIKYEDITEIVQMMEAEKVVVLLDACHSGGVKPRGSRFVSGGVYGRFWDEWEKARGHALLLSSDESQLSWEEPDGSVFTKFLIKGLEGAADLDDNAIVGFTELATYLEREIPPYTREKFGRKQTPTRRYDLGPVNGDIPLAVNHEKWDAGQRQELLDRRNATLLLADALEQELRDFALAVARSAYDKATRSEALTAREVALLSELDAYADADITQDDFALRARAVYRSRESGAAAVARVRIEVIPPDAAITLTPEGMADEVPSLRAGEYRVGLGRYRLRVSRNGYLPYDERITIDRATTNRVVLKRLSGSLRVRVTPDGATVTAEPVSVLAREAGTETVKLPLPGEIRPMPIGTYKITVMKDGYAPEELPTVAIRPDEVTTLDVALKGYATLRYATMPPGVTVTVDGVVQTLPFRTGEGAHKVKLNRPGYASVELDTTLTAGQGLDLFPDWERVTADLAVTSDPPGAEVTLDHATWGKTPMTLDDVPAGEHELELSLPDHEPVRRRITVTETSRPVAIKMTRSRGTVQVNSTPPGATVRIDGRRQGATPATLRLSAGKTTIVLAKPMHRNATREVHIGRGENPTIDVTLEPEGAAVDIVSTPPGATVTIGSEQLPEKAPTKATVVPGQHTLTLSMDDHEPYTETLTLADRDAKEIRATLQHETQLVVTSDPPGAEVALGALGTHRTPVLLRDVRPGSYTAEASTRGYSPSSAPFTIDPNERNVVDLALTPGSGVSRALRSAAVPGFGQYAGGRTVSGALFLLATVGAGTAAGVMHVQYSSALDDYDAAAAKYTAATRVDQIERSRREALAAFDDVDAANSRRQMAVVATAAIWAVNVAHAYVFGPARPAVDDEPDLVRWSGGFDARPGIVSLDINHRF
ncbi:PEGA domain-containing protein [Candidatus Poribacteria bacterium]|nr:PEGA domain-containing protein [Candidatus Poribacteria bacterium]